MSLQDELRDELGLEVPILPGENGELTVLVDGQVVFSHQDLDRLPDDGEILSAVRERRTHP